jgi:excisionase family DNA binding protein
LSNQAFLRLGTVSRRVGVSRQTVRNWCLSGRIEFIVTPSGEHRIPEAELHRILGERA